MGVFTIKKAKGMFLSLIRCLIAGCLCGTGSDDIEEDTEAPTKGSRRYDAELESGDPIATPLLKNHVTPLGPEHDHALDAAAGLGHPWPAASGSRTNATAEDEQVVQKEEVQVPARKLPWPWAAPAAGYVDRTLSLNAFHLEQIVSRADSKPWLLMSVDGPMERHTPSFHSQGEVDVDHTAWYPHCWGLHPESMQWTELSLPPLMATAGEDAAPMRLHSAGDSGLLVAWHVHDRCALAVVNPVTREWQQVPPSDPKLYWKSRSYHNIAVELEVDEESKKPRYLFQFGCQTPTFAPDYVTLVAQCYDFQLGEWDGQNECILVHTGLMPVNIAGQGGSNVDWKKVSKKVVESTHTVADSVFFLLNVASDAGAGAPGRGRGSKLRSTCFEIIGYSKARREFDVAVERAPSMFRCSWKHAMVMVNKGGVLDTSRVVSGIRVLAATHLCGDPLGPQLEVLAADPVTRQWDVRVQEGQHNMHAQGGDSGHAAVRPREDLSGILCPTFGKNRPTKFKLAPVGAGTACVAAFTLYCTKIAVLDLEHGGYKTAPTPVLPAGVHVGGDFPAAYWSKFSMQGFVPNYNYGILDDSFVRLE